MFFNVGVDSSQTTRSAMAGVTMAFFTIVLISLGKYLMGWMGVVVAVLLIMVVVRGLQPVMVRWIRGSRSDSQG